VDMFHLVPKARPKPRETDLRDLLSKRETFGTLSQHGRGYRPSPQASEVFGSTEPADEVEALDPTKERSSDPTLRGTRPAVFNPHGARSSDPASRGARPAALVGSDLDPRIEGATGERLAALLEATKVFGSSRDRVQPSLREGSLPDLRVLMATHKEPPSAARTLNGPSGLRATANAHLCKGSPTRPSGRDGKTEPRRERRRPREPSGSSLGALGTQLWRRGLRTYARKLPPWRETWYVALSASADTALPASAGQGSVGYRWQEARRSLLMRFTGFGGLRIS
jgi:hypothetical protein